MTDRIAPSAYSLTTRALHWIMAGLVLILLPLGPVIANIGAALHHHVMRGDRVLMRMITG